MINILSINLIAGRTGAAKLCKTIMEGLPYNQFNHHTLVGYNFGVTDPLIDSLYKTSPGRFYRTLRYKGAVGLNFLFDWNTLGCITKNFLTTYQPFINADIVHIHCPQGGYLDIDTLKYMTQTKKICMTLHDDWLISGNDNNLSLFPYKTKLSYRRRKEIFESLAITYIGVSNRMTQKVSQDPIIGKNNIKTIYNGINTSIFSKGSKKEVRQTLGIPINKKIILSIAGSGGKSNLKGLSYIQKIVKQYGQSNDFLFVSIGNSSKKKISDSYRELGYIENIADYFKCADVFLYPTLADSFGLVVAESLACGCPVVTFNTGGVPEIVTHKKNGYIAEYKNFEDLIKGFDRVIGHSSTLDVSLDPKFSQDHMIQQYINLYQEILKKP